MAESVKGQKILLRTLSGANWLSDAADDCTARRFNDVLAELGRMPTHELMLELGQALKVDWEDIAELSEQNGFIDESAIPNLREYFENPLTRAQLEFLQRQQGNMGQLNNEPLEGDEHSDECG